MSWTRKTVHDLRPGDRFKYPDADGDCPANVYTASSEAMLGQFSGEVEVETEGGLLSFGVNAPVDIEAAVPA